METKEYNGEWHQWSPKWLSSIRYALAALLLLAPSASVQSEDASNIQKDVLLSSYERGHGNDESIEKLMSLEIIFKDGIKRALTGLNSIDQIPVWGKKITYYRDSGSIKGKALSTESVKTLGLPEKFDISPRHVGEDPVSSMCLILGNRKFSITPVVGSISDITLSASALTIEISLLFGLTHENIVYDKQTKLPDLMYRLRTSPKGKGEKSWFKGTTVEEI